MTDFYQQFIADLQATSFWEWLAVILALAYLVLAIKESLWCWPAAFFSTAIYGVLFFDVNLYMESSLNLYYLLMAVYGWNQWRTTGPNRNKKTIVEWSLVKHIYWILLLTFVVFLSAYLLSKFTDQDLPLLDSFTTWFAVFTTYLVAKKVLENWLYWIVIDAASIYLFLSKGFALTSVLFAIYIVLAFYGWLTWKRAYELQAPQPA